MDNRIQSKLWCVNNWTKSTAQGSCGLPASHQHVRATNHPKENNQIHAQLSYFINPSFYFIVCISFPIPPCFGIWLHQTQAEEKATRVELKIVPSRGLDKTRSMRPLFLLGHDTVTHVLAMHTRGHIQIQTPSIPISEKTNMLNGKSTHLHPPYNFGFTVLLLCYFNLVLRKYKTRKKIILYPAILLNHFPMSIVLIKMRKNIK